MAVPLLSDVKAIAAGDGHTVALKQDGTVVAWGNNTNDATMVPAGLSGITAISAGMQHTVALKQNGTVVAWGGNWVGQATVPIGLKGVVAIAAGGQHSLALKLDGTVIGWGKDITGVEVDYGQAVVPSTLKNVKAIAAGSVHSVALKTDGTVVAWGCNLSGQCTVPTGLADVVAIAAGGANTAALKQDGSVIVWGDNRYNQVISSAGQMGLTAIALGLSHTVALKADHTVSAWGANSAGQSIVPLGLTGVKAIAAGSLHTVALQQDGTVVAWGSNAYGQLTVPCGLMNVNSISCASDADPDYSVVLQVDGKVSVLRDHNLVAPDLRNIKAVAIAGESQDPIFTAVKQDGTVVSWGGDWNNLSDVTVGLGVTAVASSSMCAFALKQDGTVIARTTYIGLPEATIPPGLVGVTAISAGWDHAVALKQDGTVVAWGDNQYGQTTVPIGLSGVSTIAAGLNHTVALKQDGTVVAWGDGWSVPKGLTGVKGIAVDQESGKAYAWKQDGTVLWWNKNYNDGSPTTINALGATSLTAGGDCILGLMPDGTVVDLGGNSYVPPGLTGVAAIATGHGHTIALKQDGTVITWENANNSNTNVFDEQAAAMTNVKKVVTGQDFAVALKNDGTVVAWGSNLSEQCTIPEGLTDVIDIAVGDGHVAALKQDGTVVAWGWNGYGQATVPDMLTGVKAIAAGTNHTVALKQDGTVVAWGENNFGQITIPSGLTGVKAIAAGKIHTVALKQDGTVMAWGDKYSESGIAKIPATARQVVAIAAGRLHVAALKADGTVVAWGDNLFGQTTVPAGLAKVRAITASENATFYQIGESAITSPVINVKAAQIPGTHQVGITYDLASASPCTISVQVWNEDGTNYGAGVQAAAFTGAIGPNVTAGSGKAMVLDAAYRTEPLTPMPLNHLFTKQLRFKIIASSVPSQSVGNLSNLTLLDTENPAIRELAADAGDEATYDSLNDRNKQGVFFSEGFRERNSYSYNCNLLKSWPERSPQMWKVGDLANTKDGALFMMNHLPNDTRYLPLPGIDALGAPWPWSITFDTLSWVAIQNGHTYQDFQNHVNASLGNGASAGQVQVYKRFEFPTGLNYTPAGSGLLGGVQDYDTDRANISNTAKKFVIVLHGWNTSPLRDPYAEGAWKPFFESLRSEMVSKSALAQGWDLYAYRWGQDSYTGNVNGNKGPLSLLSLTGLEADVNATHLAGGVGAGVENGTQAAEIGYQHGLVLGKLIWEHCEANHIPPEKIQFIAHSAGTWVARSASLYLKAKYGNALKQQITLLDPYNPRAGYDEWIAMGDSFPSNVDNSNLRTDLIKSWVEQVVPERAENIYSLDARVSGTNSRYWGDFTDPTLSSRYDVDFINRQVGQSALGINQGVLDFGAHSGPIRYYTFSLDPAYRFTNPAETEYNSNAAAWNKSTSGHIAKVGWEHSLFMAEYNAAPKSCPVTAIASSGFSILMTLPSSQQAQGRRAMAATAFPWQQILMDVDVNGWVRAMLVPAGGGAAVLAGPVRVEPDGIFAITLTNGSVLAGSFDTTVTPVAVSLTVDGVPFGQKTPIAQGTIAQAGFDAKVNTAGNVVFSLVLADGTVGMSVAKDASNTGWEGSGVGAVDGSGAFTVTGDNDLQITGQLLADGGLDTQATTVDAPQVPEIHVLDAAGSSLTSGVASQDCGHIQLGRTSTPLAITIKNTGTVDLTDLAVSVDGANAADFSVGALGATTLAPEASVTVNVTCAPGAAGARTAVFHIASNDANENPFDIALTGMGVDLSGFDYTGEITNETITITGYKLPGGVVVVPDTLAGLPVTGIAANAFQNNLNLTRITIPDSITSIGDRAFANCAELTAVYFSGNAPSLDGADVFLGSTKVIVYVLPETTGWGATFGGRKTVVLIVPVLTWANPKAIIYGTALSATQLNAKANVPGTYVYSPVLGSKLPVGVQSLSVTFTPTDTARYTSAQTSVPLTVSQAVATVTLTGLSQTYNGQPRTVSVTTVPAGLKVDITYAGAVDAPVIAGSYAVMATVNDPNATGSKTGTLVVAKGGQGITFPASPALRYGDADCLLTASATSGLAVNYVSSNQAVATVVDGNRLKVVGAGSVKVTASQAGDGNWKPALAVARTLVVGKKLQTIDFPALTGRTMGDADFSLSASASSGLSVTFTSSAPAVATIVAGKIHLVGKGTAVITASQAGNTNWAAATPVKQTLVVAPGSQTITFAPLPNKGVGDVDFAPGASASSGLTVSYMSSNLKVATIVAGKIHVVGNGTSTITAKQAGNASWTAAPEVTQTFTVGGKATPVITWANPAAIIYGKPLTATQLNAKANVPGTFAYSLANGTQLPVGQQSLSVTFTPNDQVKYNTANKSVSLTVNKTAATVTLAGLSQTYTGQPRIVTATTVPAGLNVVITYGGTTVAPTNAASYPVIATIDDPNAAGTKSGTLVVAKGNQTISFASLPAMHFGDEDYALTASAASGLPVSYASSNPAVATIAGGRIHVVSTGTAVITATQGGDSNWNAALPVKQTCTFPTDDQDIRALYATMKSKLETHDFQGFQALFAKDYLHQGQDLATQFADPGFINTVKTFTFAITRITIMGSDAQVAGTATVTFNNGDLAKSWTEPDLTGNSHGIGWLHKTGFDWQVAGDQAAAAVHLSTGHNNTPASDHYYFRVRAESSFDITDVTLSGPGIQDTLLPADPVNGGYTAFVEPLPDPLPAVGTKYSFLVRFADSTQATYQDSVKSWVPKAPVITVTPGVGTATVKWTNVSAGVPNASYVWVRVTGPNVFWESDDLPLTRLSAVFNDNGQAQGTLQSGQTYTAEVFIFNKNEDFASRQLQFTMP
jgi:alpha-tubulin suppressor-like RCC1 family protein